MLLTLPAAGFGGLERWLAPAKRLWPHWAAHDEGATRSIDHVPWGRLLAAYLVRDEVNLFRYGHVSPADRQTLKRFIGYLVDTPITECRRAEQFSYWVDLYNTLIAADQHDLHRARWCRRHG
ncbi:MAG: hypothetical protein PS018_00980, partial [bacterium]|nr:hypothetical protein [bacterium]